MGNKEFIDLLVYLQQSQSINDQQKKAVAKEIVTDEGLKLLDLIVFFTGIDCANDFLSSLPLTLKEYSYSADLSLNDLIATDFSCDIWNNLQGWKSIHSISFKIQVSKTAIRTLTWTFPFEERSSSKNSRSYILTYDGTINVHIEWPTYSQRSAKGDYKGTLKIGSNMQINTQETHVVGEFSMAYEQAPLYLMTFSDDAYATSSYEAGISFLFTFFNLPDFLHSKLDENIQELAKNFKQLGVDKPMTKVGFVLEKMLSTVILREVGGNVYTNSNPGSGSYEWWPFEKNSFSINDIRIVMRTVDSLLFSKILVKVNGNMTLFKPPIPIELTAGVSENNVTFELDICPNGDNQLSIQQILDVTNMSSILDVGKAFPSVANISNSVYISKASLGWGISGIDFLRLGLDIENWKIIPGEFEIADLAVSIYSTFPRKSKQFYLSGSGVTTIRGTNLGVGFEVQRDYVAFRLLLLESPLTLRTIFDHFFGESDTLFPQKFLAILDHVGIESTVIEGSRQNGGWSLSRFGLSTGINIELDLSEKFSILYPKLVVDVAYPFTKSQRVINTSISAVLDISEIFCDASITWTGANSNLTLLVQPRGEPLTLQSLISVFVPDEATLSVPRSVSFLLGIGIANAKLVLNLNKGKSILNEISATVVSTASLRLWTGLDLKNLILSFDYLAGGSKSVAFHATLSLSNADLDAILYYGGQNVPVGPTETPPRQEAETTVTARSDESWIASVTYDGEISTIDIMSNVSQLDLRKELSSVGLSALRDLIDIDMTNLSMMLTRSQREVSFTFDAHVKYLFFDGPVKLICSQVNNKWLYSFSFCVSSEDFLSNFGIQAVMLKDTVVSISNNKDNLQSRGYLALTFKTSLVLKDILQNIGKATGFDSIIISGSVSDSSIQLAASTPPITIFNDMRLMGSLIFSYSKPKQFVIAIEGAISNISFPQISDEIFSTTFSLFVKLPNPQLGFKFTLDKLKNAFGLYSLDFRDLLFQAAFQEFPLPSEVAVTGVMDFKVEKQEFHGSVAIYFSEDNLLQSGTMGTFTTFPSLNQALEGFDPAKRTAPKGLDGTFIDLEFSRAFQDVTVGNLTIRQGLRLKGYLKLPCIDLEALFDIDIAPSRIHIAGFIKNAIAVAVGDVRLFALTDAYDSGRGPSLDVKIDTTSVPTAYSSGKLFVLGLSSNIQMELSDQGLKFDNTISTSTVDIGTKFTVNSSYLDLLMTRVFDLSIPSFAIGPVSISRITFVRFEATLSTKVHWANVSWNLTIVGRVNVGPWDLGTVGPFTVNADLSDFGKIAQWLESWFAEQLGNLLSNEILQRLKNDGLAPVIDGLKAIGLSAEEISQLLWKQFGQSLDNIAKEVTRIFDLGTSEVVKIFQGLGVTIDSIGSILNNTLGHSADEVARVLKDVGYTASEIALALSKGFGMPALEIARLLKANGFDIRVITKALNDALSLNAKIVTGILKDIGYGVEDIARVLENVFGLASQGIANILKDVGFAIDDVARTLNNVFGLAANEVDAVLKNVGYAVDDVTRAMGNVFNTTIDAIGSAVNDVGNVVSDIGNGIADTAGKIFGGGCYIS